MSDFKLDPIYKIYEPLKYAYNKKKEDYVIIPPNNSDPIYLNGVGNQIVFQINSQSNWLLFSDAYIRCDFKVTNDADNGVPVGNITLENNFFPNLFQTILLQAGSNQIESITSPGEFDTMLKIILYPNAYCSDSGWIPDKGDGNVVRNVGEIGAAAEEATSLERLNEIRLAALTIKNKIDGNLNTGFIERKFTYNKTDGNSFVGSINWKLYPLLGLLENRKVSIGLDYKLTLTRQVNDNKILFGAANSQAKFSIKTMQLYIPTITPSIEVETKLLNSLTKDIPIAFLRRNCFTKSFTNAKETWNITNTSKPARYIILGFKQTDDAKTTNNNKFYLNSADAAAPRSQIQRVQVRLNNENYPNQPLTIGPNNYDTNEIYRNYKTMCELFANIPQFNYIDFINNYPIFCFDLSAHQEDLFKTGVQLSIYIEKSTDVKLNGFCLLLEEAEHIIKIQDRRMIRIE